MSLMKRLRDITVATLNEKLEHCEDPVRMIDRYLIELKEQIIETEKLYQQSLQHARSVRQQYLSAEDLKTKRENQAATALKAGEEHLARLALQEKIQHEEKSVQYKQLYEQSKHTILELEDRLKQMKSDYEEVLNKRQYYLVRLESVRLQQRMNERMHASAGYNGSAFRRWEERISDMEQEVQALSQVRQSGRPQGSAAGQGMQQALDSELASLRKRLEQEGWSPS